MSNIHQLDGVCCDFSALHHAHMLAYVHDKYVFEAKFDRDLVGMYIGQSV